MVLEFFKESIFYLLFYVALIVIVTTDKYINRKDKNLFIIAIALGISHITAEYIEVWGQSANGNVLIRELASCAGYSLRPFLILCFLQLAAKKYKHYVFAGFSTVNLILYFTSHFTHLCVYFTEDNRFHRGPLNMVVFVVCGIGLISITINSLIEFSSRHVRRWIIPPACSALIIYSVYVDHNAPETVFPSSLNKILLIVMFQFYLFYHLVLVEEYEKKVIQNQNLQLMVSQIKPHFFFNTITTIQALCNIDPSKASETLGLFASYIRQNINTQTENVIPFNEEIKHVETFAQIEKLRFPNIEVLYDFETTDFDIVTLSIQPLVENAIKHGIRSREHGIVAIKTKKNKDSITITISDNGIGFDTKTINNLDNTHIGIHNVKNRLELLQSASMDIASTTEGTTITITIPWEE